MQVEENEIPREKKRRGRKRVGQKGEERKKYIKYKVSITPNRIHERKEKKKEPASSKNPENIKKKEIFQKPIPHTPDPPPIMHTKNSHACRLPDATMASCPVNC